ncbi:MAG: polysaccharide export protein [Candidatus Thiodiazotropha sp. (ex Dulcina madagascariensis)]|nr:polysaccharide export protein [Candidatus Thiodiazotropha sp. (ex Dulcina madagascariensis)]
MSKYSYAVNIWLIVSALALGGCNSIPGKAIDLSDDSGRGQASDPELAALLSQMQALQDNRLANAPGLITRANGQQLPLSRGDRLRVLVFEGEQFSGIFEVDMDGCLHIPYIKPVPAVGVTPSEVQRRLEQALVKERIFRADFVQVSVRIQQWSGVRVSVGGAVFSPGRVLINDRRVEVKTHQLTQAAGDYPLKRFLTTAIRNAGGVRPDADLKNIRLIRNGVTSSHDISGILTGTPVQDVPLVAEDRILVPSIGFRQDALMRPSPITPPGFEIFISNLASPADSNADAAIGKESRSIPYGTRFLRGLISANCIGGTQATNASRMAVLVTTDPVTGKTQVVHRSVEQLVREHNADDLNPYLMPNDGIACYDSGVTNTRDLAKTFSDILNPLMMLRILMGLGV